MGVSRKKETGLFVSIFGDVYKSENKLRKQNETTNGYLMVYAVVNGKRTGLRGRPVTIWKLKQEQ